VDKFTKTIKIHVVCTVLDGGYVDILNEGDKASLFLSFSSGRRGSEKEAKKNMARSKYLGAGSCLFFAAAK
jgi:hypothetical protein